MPLISVIVPIYKVEPYLKECVDSILNQTFKDFELILVDDGSPDNCSAICDEYAKIDNRIVVIHKENGGLSSARNAGLDYVFGCSDSKYISFIDSDDYVNKRFLEVLYNNIECCDLSFCYYLKFKDNNHKNLLPNGLVEVDKEEYWQIPICDNAVTVAWNKLYKRDLFKEIRFPESKIFEDGLTIYKIVDECSKIKLVPNALYFYRMRPDSIMEKQTLHSKNIKIMTINNSIEQAEYYLKRKEYKQFYAVYLEICGSIRRYYFLWPLSLKQSFKMFKKLYRLRCKVTSLPKPKKSERHFAALPFFSSMIRRARAFFKD